MMALDTNVLVRYLTQDDEAQFLRLFFAFSRNDPSIVLPLHLINSIHGHP